MHEDELFMNCHRDGCDYRISKWVKCGVQLAPSELIRWHERMIRHVRKAHARG